MKDYWESRTSINRGDCSINEHQDSCECLRKISNHMCVEVKYITIPNSVGQYISETTTEVTVFVSNKAHNFIFNIFSLHVMVMETRFVQTTFTETN